MNSRFRKKVTTVSKRFLALILKTFCRSWGAEPMGWSRIVTVGREVFLLEWWGFGDWGLWGDGDGEDGGGWRKKGGECYKGGGDTDSERDD